VAGHVRSEAERLRLIERAGEVEGVGHVNATELRIVGNPYCHVLTFLDSSGLERSEDQCQDLAAMGIGRDPRRRPAPRRSRSRSKVKSWLYFVLCM
jgi:alpha-D-ribose 1-methylphosphonate 5-triphosphate synthase subunit PhnI